MIFPVHRNYASKYKLTEVQLHMSSKQKHVSVKCTLLSKNSINFSYTTFLCLAKRINSVHSPDSLDLHAMQYEVGKS